MAEKSVSAKKKSSAKKSPSKSVVKEAESQKVKGTSVEKKEVISDKEPVIEKISPLEVLMKLGSQEKMLFIVTAALVVASFFLGYFYGQLTVLKGGAVLQAGAGSAPTEAGDGIDLSVAGLKKLAKTAKVNQKKFDSCLDEGSYEQKIQDDVAVGTALGVSGTPTFFINGVKLVGAQPLEAFKEIIDAQLAGETITDVDEEGNVIEKADIPNGVGYVKGSADAPIKIVEFSDFECPFCQRAQATVEQILEEYGDQVSLEYRHFPLSFHPNAQKAGEASECAGEQGKFWEMHDAMFGIN